MGFENGECRFLEALDKTKGLWAKSVSESKTNEEKIENHLGIIVTLLGIYIEHELNACKGLKELSA